MWEVHIREFANATHFQNFLRRFVSFLKFEHCSRENDLGLHWLEMDFDLLLVPRSQHAYIPTIKRMREVEFWKQWKNGVTYQLWARSRMLYYLCRWRSQTAKAKLKNWRAWRTWSQSASRRNTQSLSRQLECNRWPWLSFKKSYFIWF